MGKAFSKVLKKLKGAHSVRMVLLGLDGAGKTTILYMLKLGELVNTIPTIGFNVETIQHKNVRLDCWDAGGQEAFRGLWRNYCQDCRGLIFVVDSADQDRMEEAKEELFRIANDSLLAKAAILVLANKQDLPNALPPEAMGDMLRLRDLKQPVLVQPAVATSGSGLVEGLDWLTDQIKKREKLD